MGKLSWTPPLLKKDNSNINPVHNTKKYECSQYRKKNKKTLLSNRYNIENTLGTLNDMLFYRLTSVTCKYLN